ncbi:DUF4760 domain-containing protein [Neisseria sp. N95_16]|uniref:DUF4760 domain-containing protein n=2 Tax=Neisseria brasiliensis TaxID=2666100 RepID=A0A5Q3S1L0_9NEIS|nr:MULTISPECIES: DUF4760 domain-containing protein [Neisseria]MRN38955.1 DUF4760 domain-containing protein [Neisseria brasiliensis]MRN39415.1 DUF4760 domain-containing protein [Neisseria brasiliensis]PJO08866.1 DUF4760 domain-containing protein [Neisseria sp. N95_16]PJO78437.1 DUF4760 domain-containing protein [Neisseria sp. N177_16]QGL26070.1 DUF4760 domain-containing protein [Neisseria brasiliensis]
MHLQGAFLMDTTTTNSITLADWLLIIQAVILFLGLGFTALSIRNNKNDNRRMATVDLILRQRFNEELNKSVETVYNLIQGDFPSLHQYLDKKQYPEERKAILTLLNYREFVAVGINTGVIDEKIYKRSFCNIIIRDWKMLCQTIEAIRNSEKGHATNFQDFEKLAKRWKRKTLKKM